MSLLLPWLSAFLFTQVVEAPLYYAFVRRPPRLLFALLPSTLTHPIVWFVMPQLFADWWTMLVVAEAFAVVGEAALIYFLYRPLGWRVVPLSLAANAASLGIGLSSRALFGWP